MRDPTRTADSYWGDLMATSGELWWPSTGRFVSAHGENPMGADMRGRQHGDYFGQDDARGTPACAGTTPCGIGVR